ncbi:diaminopimelate epimerase [Flavobacteriaceae bacterium MAR_2010_188]|nr:diaminopimelate epimerase [Flavobacteriaceae bacterium MAR_2010_188]
MKIEFFKYQGTGNDFIIIDNRLDLFDKSDNDFIKSLCNRRFGIGADGLILLEEHDEYDFTMVYYNSDGNESSMCGNGGRCITAFAKFLAIIKHEATFEAIDGLHEAKISEDEIVELKMKDVYKIVQVDGHSFLNTGSPHVVLHHPELESLDVATFGRAIRNSPTYSAEGTNVNFVKKLQNDIFSVRTYERGVEDETLSCGTGVVAVALSIHNDKESDANEITLNTKGGELKVRFTLRDNHYTDIWLIGSAEQVFKGEIG